MQIKGCLSLLLLCLRCLLSADQGLLKLAPVVSQVSSEEISVEKKEAEVALEAAIPALEEAAEALNDLKKDDITEIRSFAKPHILVQKVCSSPSPAPVFLVVAFCLALASVCLVLAQLRADKQATATSAVFDRFTSSGAAQVCECVVILKNLKDVSWAGAKSMMADTGFLKGLVEFDKDSLSDKQVCPSWSSQAS